MLILAMSVQRIQTVQIVTPNVRGQGHWCATVSMGTTAAILQENWVDPVIRVGI